MRLIVKEKGRPAQTVPLPDGARIVLGRAPQADVRLASGYASQEHCAIECAKGRVTVRDLHSKNGTFVNGKRVTEAALGDGDRLLAGTAVVLVATGTDEQTLAQLGRQFDDGNADAKVEVLGLLGELGEHAAVDILRRGLQARAPAVREAAAAALSALGAVGAGAELVACLADPAPNVRVRAKWALIRTADPAAAEPLVSAIALGEDYVKLDALNVAGMLRIPQAVPAAVQALDSDSFTVREAAVKALGALEAPAALPHLLDALGEPDRFPLPWVIEAVGRLRDQQTLPDLLPLAEHSDPAVREALGHALGGVWSRESVPILIALADDGEPAVRRAAATSLEHIRSELSGATPQPSAGGTQELQLADLKATADQGAALPEVHEDPAFWQAWWAETEPGLPADG